MTRLAALPLLGLVLAGCGLQDPYATSTTAHSPAARKTLPAAAPSADMAGQGAALASAREFMRGYLPYLYGLAPARAITAVTPQLEHALAGQPMTREDGASPSRPRLEALRVLARRGSQARARAIVSDESRVYFALDLALVQGAHGWQVDALKTNGG